MYELRFTAKESMQRKLPAAFFSNPLRRHSAKICKLAFSCYRTEIFKQRRFLRFICLRARFKTLGRLLLTHILFVRGTSTKRANPKFRKVVRVAHEVQGEILGWVSWGLFFEYFLWTSKESIAVGRQLLSKIIVVRRAYFTSYTCPSNKQCTLSNRHCQWFLVPFQSRPFCCCIGALQ